MISVNEGLDDFYVSGDPLEKTRVTEIYIGKNPLKFF